MNMNELARRVKELSKQYSPYAGEYSYGGTSGWYILILEELERLNANIESVQERLDGITTVLGKLISEADGQKSALMLAIETRFGKSIKKLLSERAGKSVRAIANELGVSKSTISSWLRESSKNEYRNRNGRISNYFDRN